MTAKEWTQRTFANLIRDGLLQIGDGYRAKHSELGGDGYMFLRAGHVSDTHIDLTAVERFRSDLNERVASKLSRCGDVVVTTKGNSTGRVTYVAGEAEPFVYSPHLSYWRSLDAETIYPKFLRYWSRGKEFRDQLEGLKSSTDMAPYLSLVDQRRLKITLPPFLEQREIGDTLCALDDKIDVNRRMNETLEAMARALFKSWFVDFDPVKAKAGGEHPWGMDTATAALFPDAFEDSDFGDIPQGWRVMPLDKVASFLNGLALQNYPPTGDSYLPVIKIAELRRGVTDNSNRASPDIPSQYIVEDGDVLFSWSGSLEVVVWCGGRGALNQHLFKVTSGEVPAWFFYQSIREHLAEFRAIASGKATTMGHIQRHHLTDALVVVPNEAVLKAADSSMSPLWNKVITNRLESRTLADLRDTLLPKLLSGEVRVGDAERAVEVAV